jgi:hypothetical protein
MPRKASNVARVQISMPPECLQFIDDRAVPVYMSRSAYLVALVRADMKAKTVKPPALPLPAYKEPARQTKRPLSPRGKARR